MSAIHGPFASHGPPAASETWKNLPSSGRAIGDSRLESKIDPASAVKIVD
jgi:hypothetical protein